MFVNVCIVWWWCFSYLSRYMECQVCPPEWSKKNGTCYFQINNTYNYETAESECTKLKATLGMGYSTADGKWGWDADGYVGGAWMGLKRETDCFFPTCRFVGFKWSDSENWDPDVHGDQWDTEPQYNLNCVAVTTTGAWQSVDCTSTQPITVCEKVCGGLPSEWLKHERTCYRKYRELVDYEEAKSKCEEEGSNLVVIKSEIKNKVIETLAQPGSGTGRVLAQPSGEHWIGLKRTEFDEVNYPENYRYTWVDGALSKEKDFCNVFDQPAFKCISMANDGKWIGTDCSRKLQYICKHAAYPKIVIRQKPEPKGPPLPPPAHPACSYIYEEVITLAEFRLKEEFLWFYYNMSHEQSISLAENIETQLNASLSKGGIMEGFQCANVTLFRNAMEIGFGIQVELYIVSMLPLSTFDANQTNDNMVRALDTAFGKGLKGSSDKVTFPDLNDIQVTISYTGSPPPTLVTRFYVFTSVSFLLDEPFQWIYIDMSHNKTRKLIENIQTQLNSPLSIGHFPGFQSVNVTFLRDVKKNVGVDLYVIAFVVKQTYSAFVLKEAVEKTMLTFLSTGLLGKYKVHYVGPSDVHVKDPSFAPNTSVPQYVFTKVSISTEKKFLLKYVEIDSAEVRVLTTVIVFELDKKLQSGFDGFQSLIVFIIRLEKGNATIDLEVISLEMGEGFDSKVVKKSIEKIVYGVATSGLFRKDNGQVHDPRRGTFIPKQTYAITRVSVILKVDFLMSYTYPDNNETMDLKARVEEELGQKWLDANNLEFALVTLIRKDSGDTVIDVTVASLTTAESFDEVTIKLDVANAMDEVLDDRDLGGFLVGPTMTSIDTPLLGTLPPEKSYVFTSASMQLKEPWKKMYRDPGSVESQKLIDAFENEMNDAFENSWGNQETEVTGLMEERKNVSVSFNVATLTMVDGFNNSLVEETLIELIKETVEDGDIGGYGVDPRGAFNVFKTQTGPLPREVPNAVYTIDENMHGYVKPGTPAWIMTIIIGVCCVTGTVFLVGVMCTALKAREKLIKKKSSEEDMNVSYLELMRAGYRYGK